MKPFHLCHFSIEQSHSAMKVGTDAICLGSWVARQGLTPTSIWDIGAGTGILSLMLAQVYTTAHITALELDEGAILDCQANFRSSPFASRCLLVPGNALEYQPLGKNCDLMISNPPYFAETTVAPQQQRARARTEAHEGLNLSSLIDYASRHLSPQGSLCLITPATRLPDLRAYATERLLRLTELCYLSHLGGEPSRVLTRWSRLSPREGYQPTHISQLAIKTPQGDYTPEYRDLTQDFLLAEHLHSATI